jgi:hypothetical protein
VPALFVLKPPRARALLSSHGGRPALPLALTPVRLPHPLPIYERMASFLGPAWGQGESLAPAPGARLDAYTVIDDVVLPEYERYVIVHWGDRVFPRADDYVGYADYTAFLPIRGRDETGVCGSTTSTSATQSRVSRQRSRPGRWPADDRSRRSGLQPADRRQPREPDTGRAPIALGRVLLQPGRIGHPHRAIQPQGALRGCA